MTIVIGADHRGFALKEELVTYLMKKGLLVNDMGAKTLEPDDDYVDFADAVAKNVALEQGDRGIVLCGSGVGVLIAANKTKGVRCGFGLSPVQVESARADDDMNVLALASDYLSSEEAFRIVDAFLNTPFTGEERHLRRIAKIAALEEKA